MRLKVRLLTSDAVVPKKAYSGDAGFDLTITRVISRRLFSIEYGTDVSIELSSNCYADVRPRSSVWKRRLVLSNSCGVIDSGYRGEIKAVFYKIPFLSRPYKVGDKGMQMIITELPVVDVFVVGSLTDSDRGVGGYGSSDNK